MTTYKGINGFAVQSVASDPSPLDEGQVWYNNATYAFKLASVTTAGTFASGGNLNTARNNLASAGAGTQTAALGFGGTPNDSGTSTGATETYNGTSWTSSPNSLSTARQTSGGAGTATAALCIAGYRSGNPTQTAEVESWN